MILKQHEEEEQQLENQKREGSPPSNTDDNMEQKKGCDCSRNAFCRSKKCICFLRSTKCTSKCHTYNFTTKCKNMWSNKSVNKDIFFWSWQFKGQLGVQEYTPKSNEEAEGLILMSIYLPLCLPRLQPR